MSLALIISVYTVTFITVSMNVTLVGRNNIIASSSCTSLFFTPVFSFNALVGRGLYALCLKFPLPISTTYFCPINYPC